MPSAGVMRVKNKKLARDRRSRAVETKLKNAVEEGGRNKNPNQLREEIDAFIASGKMKHCPVGTKVATQRVRHRYISGRVSGKT